MLMQRSDSLGGVSSSIFTGFFPSMRIRVEVGTTNSEGVRGNGGQTTIAAWQRKRRANIKGKAAGARQAGSDGQDFGRDDVKTYRGRGLTAEGGGFNPGSQGVLHCHQRWLMQRVSRCQRCRQRLGVDEQNRCHRQATQYILTSCRQGRPCSSCLAQCPWSADWLAS
ncbi:unnamed protein product [Ectocarpus sp. 4 AP-2014]